MRAGERELWLRINGNGHAFLRELGCDCGRCDPDQPFSDPNGAANVEQISEYAGLSNPRYRAATSASLLLVRDGLVEHHILVDIGPGVVNSLVDARVRWVDALLLTHWHPDHLLDINRLAECRRRRWIDQHADLDKDCCPKPPVHCTPETWRVVEERHSYEAKHRLRYHRTLPGYVVGLGDGGEDVTKLPIVTPIAVDHGPRADGCVVYLIEWEGKKVVLAWDFVVPPPSDALLADPWLVVMEANTWNPHPETGHTSLTEGLQVLRRWRPSRALFTHISGHEDRGQTLGYGWPDEVWEENMQQAWGAIPGAHATQIGVAWQGQIIRVA